MLPKNVEYLITNGLPVGCGMEFVSKLNAINHHSAAQIT